MDYNRWSARARSAKQSYNVQILLLLAIPSGYPASPLLQCRRFIHPISLFKTFEMSTIEVHACLSARQSMCIAEHSLPADSSFDNEKSWFRSVRSLIPSTASCSGADPVPYVFFERSVPEIRENSGSAGSRLYDCVSSASLSRASAMSLAAVKEGKGRTNHQARD